MSGYDHIDQTWNNAHFPTSNESNNTAFIDHDLSSTSHLYFPQQPGAPVVLTTPTTSYAHAHRSVGAGNPETSLHARQTCPSSPPASEISSIITPNAPSVASPSTRSAASRSHRHHHQHSGPHRQQLTTTLAVSPPLNMSHPMAELPRSGQEGGGLDNPMNQSTASVHEPWIPAAGARDGRPVTLSHQRPAPVVDYNMAPPSRSQPVEQQQRHNLALKTYSSHRPQAQQEGVRPPPPTASSHAAQKCIIPDCPYKAYYNYAEQEQTEYCGQGHELHAIDTGLVKPCVICKGRPRRTGERVCGRVCRERERERSHPRPRSHPHPHPHPHPSHQLGSYHGAPEA